MRCNKYRLLYIDILAIVYNGECTIKQMIP